jgi:dTDP-4-dehydrorhamnose 3,5-epimerase
MDIDIPGVRHVSLQQHGDARGTFAEIFRSSQWPHAFVQANHSHSAKRVLRGLHYHQRQADLWYVIAGRAQVGLADLRHRRDDPLVATIVLDAREPSVLYIPEGVAHGFLALTELDLIYFVTQEYDASDEHGVAWDDPTLNVPWRSREPILSDRDLDNAPLAWDSIPAF